MYIKVERIENIMIIYPNIKDTFLNRAVNLCNAIHKINYIVTLCLSEKNNIKSTLVHV